MKILNILPYSPVPAIAGGSLRMFHLLKSMARHHEVSVLFFGSEPEARRTQEAFGMKLKRAIAVPPPLWRSTRWRRLGQVSAFLRRDSFSETEARSPRMQECIDDILRREQVDLVQIEFPGMGFFRFDSDAAMVLDAHNVEYDIHRRVAEAAPSVLKRFWSQYEYRTFYPQEIEICTRKDAILTTSARDMKLLKEDVPSVPMYIVPNGVDTSYFQTGGDPTEAHSLVFTGAMNYTPNAEGAVYFLDEIFPLIRMAVPDVKVYIVGKSPLPQLQQRASQNVIVTGFVDDVRPYVQRSSVYVVPLRMGGGTRLKVLEALSMKRPIVATSIGCEGIDVVDGESVLVADEPQRFADTVVSLMSDTALQKKLVTRGYDLVRARYDWTVIGDLLEDAYGAIISMKGS